MQRVFPTPNDSLIVISFSLRKVKAVIAPADSQLSTRSRLNVKFKIDIIIYYKYNTMAHVF